MVTVGLFVCIEAKTGERAPELFAEPPAVERADILAAKLPAPARP